MKLLTKIFMVLVILGMTPLLAQANQGFDDPLYVEYSQYRTWGNGNALVDLDMFLSFEESFSRNFHQQTFMPLFNQYGQSGQVRFVHYDYPIVGGNSAHEAGWCVIHASPQNERRSNFWQFREYLFLYQENISYESIVVWVSELGNGNVDMDNFNNCFESGQFASFVEKDIQKGQQTGTSGVPIFIVEDYLIEGAQPITVFQEKVDSVINKYLDAYRLPQGSQITMQGVNIKSVNVGDSSAIFEVNGRTNVVQEKKSRTWQFQQNGNNIVLNLQLHKILPVSKEVIFDVSVRSHPIVNDTDNHDLSERIIGANDVPVRIVMYSDFTCPFCKRFHQETYGKIKENFIDRELVQFVYKDFPIVGGQRAAEAGWCAHEQAQSLRRNYVFFDYKDALFNSNTQLDDENLINLARQIGLNTNQFTACLKEGRYQHMVEQDRQQALINGVQGTPAFFINGEFIPGAQPYEVFEEVIRRQIGDIPIVVEPVQNTFQLIIGGIYGLNGYTIRLDSIGSGNIPSVMISIIDSNENVIRRTLNLGSQLSVGRANVGLLRTSGDLATFRITRVEGLNVTEELIKQPEEEKIETPRAEASPTRTCDSGCLLEGVCVPIGIRSQGNFCDVTGQMSSQLAEGNSCENNFECSTNQCSSGVCVDISRQLEEQTGLLRRILSWFGFR